MSDRIGPPNYDDYEFRANIVKYNSWLILSTYTNVDI